jgi:dethiobiotin synthase
MLDRVLVTGTSTEVGKTWVTAAAIGILRSRGQQAAAWKPVQSFDPDNETTDAEVLGAASGEDPYLVCPRHRWYEVPFAPPIAAEMLGREPFSIADLVNEMELPPELCFIEGVGGPRSPLADDGDTVTLCEAVDPDLVVLVAIPELGCINAILLAAEPFGGRELVVVLNRYDVADASHERNHRWLTDSAGLDVVIGAEGLAGKLQQLSTEGT